MLANSKPLSLFKEGFRNRISIASLMRRLNVLLSVARTFVLLESTECPVSWQCSWTADESLERCSLILVSHGTFGGFQQTKVLATESNTFKRRIREAMEIRLRKPSLNRDSGFELANIYNTILGPLRPLWSDITLLNIIISTVADEVRLVLTKYSTLTVFKKKFFALWVRKYFIIFLKSCFQGRKTIFLIVLYSSSRPFRYQFLSV